METDFSDPDQAVESPTGTGDPIPPRMARVSYGWGLSANGQP
jgi:hypothetical protein